MKSAGWPDRFSKRIKSLIRSIPSGKVATYGQIAALSGDSGGTRRVVWVLHACSQKDNLPWHRVINSRGGISLPSGASAEEQRRRLEAEGVKFDCRGRIDLNRFLWNPGTKRRIPASFLGLDLDELRRFKMKRKSPFPAKIKRKKSAG